MELFSLQGEERKLFDTFDRRKETWWKIEHLRKYVEVLERQLELKKQLNG